MSTGRETEWCAGGRYGTQTYNSDGSIQYTTLPQATVETDQTSTGSVYNNGCGWYLDSGKEAVDVSQYKYVKLTIETDADVKLMTWSGEEVASSYWEKVDTVFTDPEQAKAIGVTLKSCDDDDSVYVEKEAVIREIKFFN